MAPILGGAEGTGQAAAPSPHRLRVSLTCIEALEGGGVLTLGVLGVLARRHSPGGGNCPKAAKPPKQGRGRGEGIEALGGG